MFQDILEYRLQKPKLKFLGKTVFKMGSQIDQKQLMCPQNYFKKKVQKRFKKNKNKNKNKMSKPKSIHNLWGIISTKQVIIKTVFPKKKCCSFQFQALKCLKTCVNCVTKSVTGNLPPLSRNFKHFLTFFQIQILLSIFDF